MDLGEEPYCCWDGVYISVPMTMLWREMLKPSLLMRSSLCDDRVGIRLCDVDVEGVAGDVEPVFVRLLVEP